MKVAIVGSRSFNNREWLYAELDNFQKANGFFTVIVSGGASGADTIAADYAHERGIDTQIIKPEWQKYGAGAGIIRNAEIVRQSDIVIAFWDGKSCGTSSTIKLAQKTKKPLTIFRYE